MRKRAKGMFEIQNWDEKTIAQLGPGAKLTEAKVTQKFSGDLGGDGTVVWVMCYVSEKSARFVGMQRVAGTLGDRTGSFVMETDGEFDGEMARWHASVVPGSGTDGLAGIEGEGRFEAPHGSKATFSFDYSFAESVVSR